MKLVVFGLTVTSSYGNGHATLWRGLCRGLSELGHRVVFFERDVWYYRNHRDLDRLAGCELVLYEDWAAVAVRAARELEDADVGMVTSYCPDALAATEAVLAAPGLAAFYDLDTPVTLARLAAGEPVEYLGPRGLADFDRVLSYTGGGSLAALADRLGARDPAPLYGSVDPEAHRPTAVDPRYAGDLSYLGTYAEDRQEGVERLLLEPARRLPERRFVLGGPLYPDHGIAWPGNLLRIPHVAPPDHPAFYCSAPLTVNVTRRAMAETGWCPSGRLFEAAACGVPVVSDRWPGIETFFAPGREILLADGTEEVVEAVRRPREELAEIGRAARTRVLADHTSLRRADQMVELLTAGPGRGARPAPLGEPVAPAAGDAASPP